MIQKLIVIAALVVVLALSVLRGSEIVRDTDSVAKQSDVVIPLDPSPSPVAIAKALEKKATPRRDLIRHRNPTTLPDQETLPTPENTIETSALRTIAALSSSSSSEGMFEELAREFREEPISSPRPTSSSRLIGGSFAPHTTSETTFVPPPTATPSPTSIPRLTGQSRGFAALYLMHPNARPAVDEQVRILKSAEVREVYLGVLTDGTFGLDFDYLNAVVRSLNEDGRVLTLELYLTNGPTMRDYRTTTIARGFNRINPDDFRYLIRNSPSIREEFREMVRATIPTFELNRNLNSENRNYAAVMLEDNLDQEAYVAMRALAQEVLAGRATFIRNPCPGCWKGSDSFSLGDPVELHHPNALSTLKKGDGITLDGVGYAFPGEADQSQLSLEAVRSAMNQAQTKGLAFFGLWRKQRQGIEQPKIHPDLRNYEIPSAEQAALEIDLLRSGLSEVP